MFLDGSPSVLASWVDLLLSIPFHILLLLSSLGFKWALASYAQNRWYSPCYEFESTIQHLWANLPATLWKCHRSPLSMSQLFLHNKWHFTGMHTSTKQAEIQVHEQREVFFDWLLHLSHSLAWGLIEFQGAAQEVGKRNSLGSYVQVFYASKDEYIGGIILTKHRTPDAGWDFCKRWYNKAPSSNLFSMASGTPTTTSLGNHPLSHTSRFGQGVSVSLF